MSNRSFPIPAEASQALDLLRAILGPSLRAVLLHGSAVSGGLRPGSDVDLIAVVSTRPTQAARARLVAGLLAMSARHPASPGGPRCIELIVFGEPDLATAAHPARAEFVYGEWLRADFEAGAVPEPTADPEFTLLLAQARREAVSLLGPPATLVLPSVPDGDVRRAIAGARPALLAGLDGDERNVLLTLARMWFTLATGDFAPKDVAAAWAISRLPDGPAGTLAVARDDYLGVAAADWQDRRAEARRAAAVLGDTVVAAH